MALEPWLDGLYDAQEMRAADGWAIEEQGVASLELMEAAGAAVADAVGEVAGQGPVRVVCGKGNNGGDGLVAARLLRDGGHEAEALLVWPRAELSPDAAENLRRFDGSVRELGAEDGESALARSGAVVDAIFGTGFSGAPRQPAAGVIEAIGACGAPVVAADIASGVDAGTGEVEGVAVEADVTVSFHGAKLGHWIAPGKRHTGELRVAPIGIPPGAPTAEAGGRITHDVLPLLQARGPESTKFSSGQVVVAGGSRGLTGAVCMSASAAIRAGAGYATVAVPADLEPIFEIKLTEVMSRGCAGPGGRLGIEAKDEILGLAERAQCVVLGPGLGRAGDSLELARELAARIEAPLVIDADGLNALAGRLESLRGRAAPTLLTPHAGELGRLLERDSGEVSAQRLAAAREGAERSGAIVVLKGDDTLVCDSERLAVNGFGAPALATAGTGDVLSGMIAALVARGLDPFAGACAAVLAHARSGRYAGERLGAASVVAGDVIDAIPQGLAVP